MTNQPHFAVYDHQIVKDDGQRINRQFIVLRTPDGLMQFCDFHKYIKTSSAVKKETSDGNSRFSFVTKMLNYAFFTVGIQSFANSGRSARLFRNERHSHSDTNGMTIPN